MNFPQPESTGKLRIKWPLPDFHWVYKSLDAALTAHIRPHKATRDLFHSVIRRRSSNYNRIASLIKLFDRLRPGLAKKTARSLIDFRRFPLHGYTINLLAFGSGATVFLLKKQKDRLVLKVFRRSLGKAEAHVLSVAHEYKEKYHFLTCWFNQTDPVVAPSLFLVLHGPLLGVTSAAVLQSYVPGKKYDLFLDFSVEEIIQLAKKDAVFCRQVLDFAANLFKSMEETGRCFDLVGRENLMMVKTGRGNFRLRIADVGVFDIAHLQENMPALYERLETHLHHLKQIQEGLQM